MSFFEELKRRNVVRVGIAYAVAAWIILQLTDVVGEILELPDWGGKLILVMVVVGFFLALFLAWAFELTPDGVKREAEVDREASTTPSTGRKLDRVIIGLLVVALGYFIWESRFKPAVGPSSAGATASQEPASTPGTTPATNRPMTADAEPATGAGDDSVMPAGSDRSPNGKSIVVLPFVNMSADPEQEYFSDGLSEEVLNALAQIDDLRVISRTSAFAFKDKDLSIPDIAAQLQVSHVLEGSVRTAGEQVRITAQLIEVATDSHLWSEAYSRSLVDVFEVQEEISRAIAGQLELRLTENALSAKATNNADAYRLFLRGRFHYQQRGGENLARALPLLEEAVALDPQFDEAWANLAAARLVSAFAAEEGHETLYAESRNAADTAISIDPNNGLAHGALGLLALRAFEFDTAVTQLDRAIALSPNESNTYLWKGIALLSLGYVEDALATLKQAEAFDPAFGNLHNWLINAYLSLGDKEAALRHLNIAKSINPDFVPSGFIRFAELEGGVDAVESAVKGAELPIPDDVVAAFIAGLRDPAMAPEAVEKINAVIASDARFLRASWLLQLGAVEDALNAYRAEIRDGRGLRVANSLGVLWDESQRESLQHEAVPTFAEEMGLAQYWRKHGDPDYCRAVGDRFECGAP